MSATDPYAARGPKRAADETRSDLEQFAQRLEQLGASDDEVAQVRDTWDQLEPADPDNPEAWTAERRAELVRANDETVVAMINAARQEYAEGTTTEDEEAAARQDALRADADRAVEGSVADVLAWVGDDRDRAAAALAAETDGDEGRKTLVGPLRELLGG